MRKFTSLIILLLASSASAQIVDDSTKLVYGPHTVLFTYENLIKNNFSDIYVNPDTLVYEMEKYNSVDRSNRRFQSLGFLGSPLFDLEYEAPSHPGRTMGFSGYDQYFKPLADIRYFDTKSPYMDVGVVLGGDNRTKIDFTFSRNINPHWNIGFDINRITADKQIGSDGQGDRATESSLFDIYVNYFNEEKPYGFAASITSMNHTVDNIGGVLIGTSDSTRADFFQYQESDVKLDEAPSQDSRRRYHVYQQFKLGSGFQLYHQMDYNTQQYQFKNDSTDSKYDDFHTKFYLDSGLTRENTTYSDFTNEAGLKGGIKGAFYRFYLKRRELIYNPKGSLETTASETYAGTYLRFDWKERFSVSGLGELSNEGAYKLTGNLSSDLIKVSYTSQRALQSFLVQSYAGNHHNWNNDFSPLFTNELKGSLNISWNRFDFEPRVTLSTMSNLVYFNQNQEPQQQSSAIVLNKLGGRASMDFFRMNEDEYFRLENEVTALQYSGAGNGIIKTPNFRYAGRIFWRGLWFQNAVPVEVGADLFYRTSFKGQQYDPVITRYYIQEDLRLENYLAVDVFVNMKIRSLRAFVKWTHVNQQRNDGYMETPYYPGQKAIIDLGVQWLFFD